MRCTGPPGAGKGSQCRRLAEQYNLEHISCGELMRHQKAMGTMLGQYLDDHWQLHKLSAIATDLVVHTIKKAQASGKGFILDGSPRTPREAEMLAMAFTANGIGLDGVIELVVSEEVATRRLLARRVHQPSGRIYNLGTCPPQKPGVDDVTGEELTQRADDLTAQGIEVRFRAYDAYGAQVHSFFEKPESGVPLYFKVDAGVDDLDAVHAELQRVVAPLVDINSKRSVFSFVRGGDEDKADLDDRDSEKATTAGMAGGQRVGAADSAVILQQIKLLVRSSKPASRFPGSHPVALTSKNIKQLLDDDYRVAPKIDGERRFLALLDERLYLIDRRMRVELFPAIRFPARYNRTIFDGEVVAVDQPPTAEGKNENENESDNDNENENESEATRRWYFVIFDVVCAEGEYVCHMPLHERLNLAKPVIESVEAAPFELTFQDYHPLDRIHAVFRQQRLHHVGGGQGDETEAEAGKNEKEKSDDDDGEEDDDDNASFFPTDGLLFAGVL
ncbi:Adenylate kinase [Acanthamoeba castellanii str. Neff]|uniref:Adenylate kinase n=1 Tax=Acanthamoeba castellanii (strain ATCC 30010 / Neff) TaxID=1257118 RepID=L8HGJ8_ACACF|nr:Adenylate kinase [Acanthamoeba castellanii str. Neff]ELR23556.1 Adenylate kinase [Acanthamoeba castellanii str. Neff]